MYLLQTGSIWSLVGKNPIPSTLTSLQQAAVGDSSLSRAPRGSAHAPRTPAPRAGERRRGSLGACAVGWAPGPSLAGARAARRTAQKGGSQVAAAAAAVCRQKENGGFGGAVV